MEIKKRHAGWFGVLLAVAATLVACSGNSSSIPGMPHGMAPAPQATPGRSMHPQMRRVRVKIRLRRLGKHLAGGLHHQYTSPSTQGMAITISQSPATPGPTPNVVADISPSSSTCSLNPDGSRSCLVNFSAPIGSDTFSVQTYDQPPLNGSPQGNLLGISSVTQNIVAGSNGLSLVIGGVATKLSMSPQIIPTVEDSKPHPVRVIVNAQDADGNYIVGSDPLGYPISVAVQSGDAHNTVAIATPPPGTDQTAFIVKYNGGPIDSYVTLYAWAGQATLTANSYIIPLVASPTSLTIPYTAGSTPQTATLVAQQALTTGPYRAVSSDYSTCQVSSTPITAIDNTHSVSWQVTGLQPGNCTITISTALGSVINVPVAVKSGTGGAPVAVPGQTKIKHVVFVIQENRSFDNLFTGFCNENGQCSDSPTTGPAHDGSTIARQPIALSLKEDPNHLHSNFLTEYNNGLMNGFDLETYNQTLPTAPSPPPDLDYDYVQASDLTADWALASKNALAERFFQSNSSASFVSHQYLIAGQAANTVDVPDNTPWGCDAPAGTAIGIFGPGNQVYSGPFPCFYYTTLAGELDAKNLTWKYYAPNAGQDIAYIWSAFDAIDQIRFGPEWNTNISSPETNVLTDAQNCNLPAMSWVTPSSANSDHPFSGSATGPSWVASIVNAIDGGSCGYWDNTAIFIVWDDWGGWYDHVAPKQIDQEGLGMRVPMIAVSAYAKHGYISMKQHEFGSMLRFAEETFGLPSMGQRDAISDDLSDMFSFGQTPPSFTPFRTRHTLREVLDASRRSQGQVVDRD